MSGEYENRHEDEGQDHSVDKRRERWAIGFALGGTVLALGAIAFGISRVNNSLEDAAANGSTPVECVPGFTGPSCPPSESRTSRPPRSTPPTTTQAPRTTIPPTTTTAETVTSTVTPQTTAAPTPTSEAPVPVETSYVPDCATDPNACAGDGLVVRAAPYDDAYVLNGVSSGTAEQGVRYPRSSLAEKITLVCRGAGSDWIIVETNSAWAEPNNGAAYANDGYARAGAFPGVNIPECAPDRDGTGSF